MKHMLLWPSLCLLVLLTLIGIQSQAPAAASAAPAPTATALTTLSPVTLTVVYNNIPFDKRLTTGWGFACLIETDATTVLFDTGVVGSVLMDNLAALAIDPRKIDRVVLSHYHDDHTAGLDALLDVNDHLTVYVPRSFPAPFKTHVAERARVQEVGESAVIARQIRTTGEVAGGTSEQALIVETGQGLILVTGCAHPGIVKMVQHARLYGDVYFIMGGFHLMDRMESESEAVVTTLKTMGIQKVAPSHCTGDVAILQFQAAFGTGFVPSGAGVAGALTC